jgi:hypothetical protein
MSRYIHFTKLKHLIFLDGGSREESDFSFVEDLMGRKHTWRKVLLSCSESVKPYCSYECFQGKSCMVQRGAKKRTDDPQAYFTSDIFYFRYKYKG